MVDVQMRDPYRLRPEYSRGTGQSTGRSYGDTRYLQGNHGRLRNGTANYHQSSPNRDIESSGKLQRIIAARILRADKNGYGEL